MKEWLDRTASETWPTTSSKDTNAGSIGSTLGPATYHHKATNSSHRWQGDIPGNVLVPLFFSYILGLWIFVIWWNMTFAHTVIVFAALFCTCVNHVSMCSSSIPAGCKNENLILVLVPDGNSDETLLDILYHYYLFMGDFSGKKNTYSVEFYSVFLTIRVFANALLECLLLRKVDINWNYSCNRPTIIHIIPPSCFMLTATRVFFLLEFHNTS